MLDEDTDFEYVWSGQSHLIIMKGGVFHEDSDNETGELVLQSWSVFLGDARRKTLEASIHVHHHLLDLCMEAINHFTYFEFLTTTVYF